MDVDHEAGPALGTVVDLGRGSLPYSLLHGESLVACAAWALGDSGVTPVDFGTEWAGLQESGEPFVLHDSLCPLTPATFIAECLQLAVDDDVVVVGARPVTDTVKETENDVLGATVDREQLRMVTSPIVLPARVVGELADVNTDDFARLAEELRQRFEVRFVEAPAVGRRVCDEDDVRLLEALSAPGGSLEGDRPGGD